MLKLTLKAITFILLLFVLDFSIGKTIASMYSSLETGTSGARINHLINHKYDVYVMGASTARHGYVPEILEESLRLSVYNAGENGTNILYHYSLLQLITEHHVPKIIIWDISNADFYFTEMNAKVEYLLPYTKHHKIKRLVENVNPLTSLALISKIYPYNQKVFAIVTSFFGEKKFSALYRGYDPLDGVLSPTSINNPDEVFVQQKQVLMKRAADMKRNKVIQTYFNAFVKECLSHKIKLVAVSSPKAPISRDFQTQSLLDDEIKRRLNVYHVPLIQVNSIDVPELNRLRSFKDISHLNGDGACIFSTYLADRLTDLW